MPPYPVLPFYWITPRVKLLTRRANAGQACPQELIGSIYETLNKTIAQSVGIDLFILKWIECIAILLE